MAKLPHGNFEAGLRRWQLALARLSMPPPQFENHLAAADPVIDRRPVPWKLLAALVLLCLVPRALMAMRLDVVCPDAILYLDLAKAIESGDLRTGLTGMHLNTLPVALMLMHRLGFDWETGGEVWGVLMSTLTILPLFGWTRRQFDNRIAAIAAVLYAVHPGLIERSPEILREPTFWFGFMLSLYFLWRAVAELRWHLFFAAGMSIAFAATTRFEGLFLLIPFLGWLIVRGLALRTARWRLAAGSLVTLFAFPALLLAVNALWIHNDQVWKLFRLDPLHRAHAFLETWTGWGEHSSDAARPPDGGMLPRRLSSLQFVTIYVVTVLRGFDPVVALLIPVSLVGWWPLWRRRDQWPLWLLAGAFLAGTWIHLWYAQEVSSRYASPIFLLAAPWVALGLCWPAERRTRWAGALSQRPLFPAAVMVMVLVGLGIFGWADAFTSNYRTRESGARLGHWIAAKYGAAPVIVGSRVNCLLPSYYAHCKYLQVEPEAKPESLLAVVEQSHADVVLLASNQARFDELLTQHAARLQICRLPSQELPEGCAPRTIVYAHRAPSAEISQAPPTTVRE